MFCPGLEARRSVRNKPDGQRGPSGAAVQAVWPRVWTGAVLVGQPLGSWTRFLSVRRFTWPAVGMGQDRPHGHSIANLNPVLPTDIESPSAGADPVFSAVHFSVMRFSAVHFSAVRFSVVRAPQMCL